MTDAPILFAPDANLGAFLMRKTGREMELWPGTCIVHVTFSERKIIDLKMRHPRVKFIAHPECEEQVLRHADFIGSTRKLLDFVCHDPAEQFIIGTESGILHTMAKADIKHLQRADESSMPSYAKELSSDELQNLIAYLFSLRRK